MDGGWLGFLGGLGDGAFETAGVPGVRAFFG